MGKSSGQVTGYRYFTNFLLFIGNPIEKLLNINFDKRGWIANERISYCSNGEMIYIENINLYGENEGGVAGTMRVKHGTNNQTASTQYKKYMNSLGLPASAYPCQSYIMFGGGGFPQGAYGKTPEELEIIGDDLEASDKYYDGGFYVGNSGYMKEMLLWPKRTRIRNDGRRQWYETREDGAVVCELGAGYGLSDYVYPFFQIVSIRSFGAYNANGDDVLTNYDFYREAATQSIEIKFRYRSGRDFTLTRNIDFGEGSLTSYVDFGRLNTIDTEFSGHKNSKQDIIELKAAREVVEVTYVATATIDGTKFPDDIYSGVLYFRPLLGTPDGGYISNGVNAFDINPIHKIREILTDDTAMSKPETSVNDLNFMKAADRIFDEFLGVSWSITEKSCIDAINELCYHIEAGIRVNRQTGLYEIVLFRDDWFEDSEIHTIAESKIKSMQYEITNADEVINQVNVNFYDRENIKNSSFSISENGLIQTLGRVNAETLDFPYFMNMRNAEIVANWKLKQLSTGAFKGSLTTGWREARKWNRYDLIRLPWSKRWTGTILVRIMSINLGGPANNEVSIEFIEVVPATGMMNTTIVADDSMNTQPQPPQLCNAKVFELPYFEAVQTLGEREVNTELADNPEAGYLCAIAEKPQNNSLSAALHIDSGNGFERVATVNYCETAYLDQAIDRLSSTFIVKNIGNIASVRTGSQIFINDEIMVYQSYDAETKALTVKRAALDSVPQNHASNTILYFADDFIAVDQTLYVESEIIDAKVLTTTPSGVLALDDAETHAVELKARANRPYPPANVTLNGQYFPARVIGDLTINWVSRNRLQQTGGEILSWFDGGIVSEENTNYSIKLLIGESIEFDLSNHINTNITIPANQLNGQRYILQLKARRDGLDSYQIFEHEFLHRYTVERISRPYNLSAVATNEGIQLAWDADEYTSQIDYYNIYRNDYPFDGSDVTYLNIAMGVVDKNFLDITAEPNITYYYRIEAIVEQNPEEIGMTLMSEEMVSAKIIVELPLIAHVSKSIVTGSTLASANISVSIDESLKANMKFDGSSINGKAQAGSIITIEVND